MVSGLPVLRFLQFSRDLITKQILTREALQVISLRSHHLRPRYPFHNPNVHTHWATHAVTRDHTRRNVHTLCSVAYGSHPDEYTVVRAEWEREWEL